MIIAISTTGPITEFYLPELEVSETWESGRELSDGLLLRIQNILLAHGSDISELSGIIIHSGPGSFTSLRIGHSVANALAVSLNIPIVGGKGEDWVEAGVSAIRDTVAGQPVWPFYGAEANITSPKA